MTFEQFLATRAWHDNIESVNPNATGAREGYGYLNNEMWIEVQNWSDPASPAKRTRYLRIANCEWESRGHHRVGASPLQLGCRRGLRNP